MKDVKNIMDIVNRNKAPQVTEAIQPTVNVLPSTSLPPVADATVIAFNTETKAAKITEEGKHGITMKSTHIDLVKEVNLVAEMGTNILHDLTSDDRQTLFQTDVSDVESILSNKYHALCKKFNAGAVPLAMLFDGDNIKELNDFDVILFSGVLYASLKEVRFDYVDAAAKAIRRDMLLYDRTSINLSDGVVGPGYSNNVVLKLSAAEIGLLHSVLPAYKCTLKQEGDYSLVMDVEAKSDGI